MPTKVLDSWALMAFFEDEPAAEQVEKILSRRQPMRNRSSCSAQSIGVRFIITPCGRSHSGS